MILIYWKIVLFEMYFFLYEKLQSQLCIKVMCQEMDPYSIVFYLFEFIEKELKCHYV